MNYLIAIDSDGTLRRSDGTISDYTKLVIKKILNNGHIVVVSTGRPRYHTLEIAGEIESDNYLISSNGSEIYDNINKEVIWASYIDYNICLDIYNYAKENDVRVVFVSENIEYVTMFKRNDSQILINNDMDLSVLNNNIKQILVIGSEKDKVKKFKKFAYKKYDLNIVESTKEGEIDLWFGIINKDVSKGAALLKLAEHLNIPIENTIAIGNDNNDIPMFETAGIGIAVDNANAEIKLHADKIIESNDNDGVAKYLESILK